MVQTTSTTAMQPTPAYIYNQSDIETAQPVSVADIRSRSVDCGISAVIPALRRKAATLTAPRIYRRQLALYRRAAVIIDRHPVLSNTLLAAQIAGFIYYIFMYA